jgi:UDP-N-acetylmuramoyl-L-alanyl-D-glutamate--2,6-diaminopimelate ligase
MEGTTLSHLLSLFQPKPDLTGRCAMNLRELLAAAFRGAVPDLPDVGPVTGVTADSRNVRAGSVFVAIAGTTVDGTRYAPEAVEKGALAVVAERRIELPRGVPLVTVPDARAAISDLAAAFYGHPAVGMTITGITGTNGKTSTSLLLRSILTAAGRPAALLGTIQYEIGERKIPAMTTTPDPVSLMGFLAEARDRGMRHAVMEVSSHALTQMRTRGIDFAVAVFTNLSSEHLDYHGDYAKYRAAKSLLFSSLAPGATAVLNAEDPASNHMAARCRGKILRYGTSEASAVRARDIESGTSGISFVLATPGGEEAEIRSPLLGQINVMNCLAAAAAAHAQEIPLETIRKGLTECPVVPGRIEPVEAGQPFTVLVDYAHTDDALRNVLKSVRAFAGDRRILTVMGCGGDRDRTKRPRMGQAAAEASDHVIITSDNPRSEEPMAIIRDIVAGLTDHTNFEVVVDRREAIRTAVGRAGPDDIVLIAGKGHETYQLIQNVAIPFDDRQVVREEIGKLPGISGSEAGPSGT